MRPLILDDRCALFAGDSARLGDVLEPNSVDAIVSDPPAGISFMGSEWDSDKGGRDAWIKWLAELLRPAFAALKPGGHALLWAIPRTSHWTAMALELAGFEIRDVHHHIFGTGMPKSLTPNSARIPEGTGTALKPAVEHWILARKPLSGTVAATFAEHGTGLLNIDACRIGHDDPERTAEREAPRYSGVVMNNGDAGGLTSTVAGPAPEGRWPAHLSLDEFGAAVLDVTYGGKGGASRFFYVAKGSRSEKDAGLEHLPARTGGEATGRTDDSAGVGNPRAGAGRTGGARNFHPTVKSIALMRWLVRLITPPGGTVLDMFAGSGTTGVAALAEGMCFIGVEQGGRDGEYLPIVEGRLRHALGGAS